MSNNLIPNKISEFSQPNTLTANDACIDVLRCPLVLQGAVGGGGGIPGPVGPPGANGPPGPPGTPGGPPGVPGPPGINGGPGPTGPTGNDGPTGPAGADGADGADGGPGPPGVPGNPGADGADGADGAPGPTGADGNDGGPGPPGPNGPTGNDGPPGPTGPTGPPGPTGTPGDAALPYEPYNLNIATLDLNGDLGMFSGGVRGNVRYMQFIAPTTANYTTITLFTTQSSSGAPNFYDGLIGAAIYENFNVNTSDGPSVRIGQGGTSFTTANLDRKYVDVTFTSPVPLVKDTLYWAAVAYNNSGPAGGAGVPYFAYYAQPTGAQSFQVVLENTGTNGGYTGLTPTGNFDANLTLAETQAAPTVGPGSAGALWFRLYNINADFIVGPEGPTGPPGSDGTGIPVSVLTFGAYGGINTGGLTNTWQSSGINVDGIDNMFLFPGYGAVFDLPMDANSPNHPAPIASVPWDCKITEMSYSFNGVTPPNFPTEVTIYVYCQSQGTGLPPGNAPGGPYATTLTIPQSSACGCLSLPANIPLVCTTYNCISVKVRGRVGFILPPAQFSYTGNVSIGLKLTT